MINTTKNIRNSLLATALLISLAGIGVITYAQSITFPTYPLTVITPKPVVVEIDGSGNVLLRGRVETTGTSQITISSWGGIWTVRTGTNSTAEVQPANVSSDFSSLSVGDFVGIMGTPANDAQFTIDATFVRNWTTAGSETAQSPMPVQIITPIMPLPTPTPTPSTNGATTSSDLYTGVVASISPITNAYGSLNITDPSGVAYVVNTDMNTILWNSTSSPIMFLDIQPGDSVRLNGTLNGNTINATVVRDVSR